MRRIVGIVGVVLALILPAVDASQTSDDVPAAASSQTQRCTAEAKRQQAEQARPRVWAARDAAARIGR